MRPVCTFSIVAREAATGDLGIAVASKFLAVGAIVPYAVADVAAVATQSYANTSYGPRLIRGLQAGASLEHVHEDFAASDPEHAERQYGAVDAAGRSFTFTGEACKPWAGGVARDGLAVQGNLLVGPEVVERMVDAYLATDAALPERLLAALSAGDEAGGDRRGKQAAALLVVRAGGGYGGFDDRYVDLRVDDDREPTARLRELLARFRVESVAE